MTGRFGVVRECGVCILMTTLAARQVLPIYSIRVFLYKQIREYNLRGRGARILMNWAAMTFGLPAEIFGMQDCVTEAGIK